MLTLMLMLTLATGTAAANPSPTPKTVASLAFMSGCWHGQQGDARLEEHWLSPAGDGLLGVSRVVAGGRTVFREFMEIRQQPGGEIVMSVQLGLGKAPVAFTLSELGPEAATFENPAHDFPQRLRYWKEGGLLRARVDGRQQGTPKAEDFEYTRGACQ